MTVRNVARAFLTSPESLLSTTRGTPHVAIARQTLMYCLYYARDELTFTRVGELLGRYRKTVSHGIIQTQKRCKTDKDFDTRLGKALLGR